MVLECSSESGGIATKDIHMVLFSTIRAFPKTHYCLNSALLLKRALVKNCALNREGVIIWEADYVCLRTVFPNPGPWVPTTLQFRCSLDKHTSFNSLWAWWLVEPGVFVQGYNTNVYCWGYSRTRVGKQCLRKSMPGINKEPFEFSYVGECRFIYLNCLRLWAREWASERQQTISNWRKY